MRRPRLKSNNAVVSSTIDYNNILFGYDVTNPNSVAARKETIKLNTKLRVVMKKAEDANVVVDFDPDQPIT